MEGIIGKHRANSTKVSIEMILTEFLQSIICFEKSFEIINERIYKVISC